jgi:hypothetical protein
MPSPRDPKLGVLAMSPAGDRVLPVELDHTSLYDLQHDTAFRFGLNRILICDAQPKKSICDVSEPMFSARTSLGKRQARPLQQSRAIETTKRGCAQDV